MSSEQLPEPTEKVRYWLNQIEQSQKWHNDWHEHGKEVNKRYLDEREVTNSATGSSMNVLWSNVQTVQPALYAKTPNPKVQRRFRDKDNVGRWAAIVMERCEAYELDAYDDDYHYRTAILDYLLPGRGQVWVQYEPKFVSVEGAQRLSWECTKVRHLDWKHFLTNKARTWDEVWWVAKGEYLSEEEAKAAKLKAEYLNFTEDKSVDDKGKEGQPKKALVWEIWDRLSGKIYFVSKSSPELLREPAAPPFMLDGFFPCPRPLTATTTPDSILPTPDYCQYQDQAKEIDQLTRRINLLTKALRVAGIYDTQHEALGKLLDDTSDNVMIACETYAVLASQGGIEGSVTFFPIEQIIKALKQCYESRDQAMAVMYQITGISDIVRGASDPGETATAQQIKSQWGGLRIRDRQKEVQRFIRDTIRIKSEIRAEVFQAQTLKAMSNVPLLSEMEKKQLQARQQQAQMLQQAAQQNPQMAQMVAQQRPDLAQMAKPLSPDELQKLKEPAFDEVYKLLKDQKLRGYRIDIETDSTIQADEAEEKQARTEYVGAMTSFMQAWGPMIQVESRLGPLAGEIMMFATRAFKTAEGLETAIQEFVDSIQQQPPQPPPQEGQGGPAEDPRIAEGEQKLKNKELDQDFALESRALDIEERGQAIDAQFRGAELELSERQDIRGGMIQQDANKQRFQQRPRGNA